jgi:hypothetical protein
MSISTMLLYLALEYAKENYFFPNNKKYQGSLENWAILKGKAEVLIEIRHAEDVKVVFEKQLELLEQQAMYQSEKALRSDF